MTYEDGAFAPVGPFLWNTPASCRYLGASGIFRVFARLEISRNLVPEGICVA